MNLQSTADTKYNYDIEEIRPIYSSSSFAIAAFNLNSQKLEKHVISFLDIALSMCPEHNGKIECGYFVHGYEEGTGPYKEWVEVESPPHEFFGEVFETGEAEYRIDNNLKKKYLPDVHEAIHKILNERISKGN